MEFNRNIIAPADGHLSRQRVRFQSFEHGSDIEDLFSRRPSFLVRKGTFVFFGLFLLFGIIAWQVRYPDMLVASGKLNSINAPKEVIARVEGKLVKLFARENKEVSKGDILGYIESTAQHDEVLRLSDSLDEMLILVQKNKANEVFNQGSSFGQLGELQIAFQVYTQAFQEFTNYLPNGYNYKKKVGLEEDIVFLLRTHSALVEQKSILSQDLLLADSTFQVNVKLRQQNVISSFEFRNERSKVLAKELTLPQIAASIIDNERLQHEKESEILELENRTRQQEVIFSQALNTFRSQVEEWKRKYLLVAPVAGRILFASFTQENQEVKVGQLICFIKPLNSNYYVEARVSQYNFGKVKTGQQVLLKFTAYPFQEFGIVRATLAAISAIPTDSGYFVKITLPSGLITNYGRTIQYKNGLSVQAEIITEDKRLIERLFENVIKQSTR